MARNLSPPRSTALTAAKRTPRAPRIAAVRVVGVHHCPETGGWMESKTAPTLPRAFAATAWMRSLLSTGPLALGTSGAVIRRDTRTVRGRLGGAAGRESGAEATAEPPGATVIVGSANTVAPTENRAVPVPAAFPGLGTRGEAA